MFTIHVVRTYRLDRQQRERFHQNFTRLAEIIREEFAMISKEVQDVLDRAKQSTSLVQSVHLGMEGLKQQVADMKAKIDSMPAGNVLSDDDKAALQEATGQLDNTINALKSDIPANTSAEKEKGADAGGQQAGTNPDDGNAQQSQGDQGAAQSGGPQPLPGTGQG